MQSPSSLLSSNESDVVRVPDWVDSGLQKRRKVTFLPAANQFLQDLASSNSSTTTTTASSLSSQQQEEEQQPPSMTQLQFYGPNSPWADSPHQAITNLKQCIYELLSVDVRSAWQTKKAREGKFQAERSSRVKEWSGKDDDDATTHNNASGSDDSEEKRDNESKKKRRSEGSQLCTQQIDNLLVRYTIEEPGSVLYREGVNTEDNNNNDGGRGGVVDERSMGSGAEDIVVVHTISFLK